MPVRVFAHGHSRHHTVGGHHRLLDVQADQVSCGREAQNAGSHFPVSHHTTSWGLLNLALEEVDSGFGALRVDEHAAYRKDLLVAPAGSYSSTESCASRRASEESSSRVAGKRLASSTRAPRETWHSCPATHCRRAFGLPGRSSPMVNGTDCDKSNSGRMSGRPLQNRAPHRFPAPNQSLWTRFVSIR